MEVAKDGMTITLVCNRTESKIVDIISVSLNASSNNPPIQKSIHYQNDKSELLKGNLSKDMECCYINIQDENVFFDQKSDIQLSDLHWFKGQIVHKMKEVTLSETQRGPGFLCITAKPFDNKLTILHTNDPKFSIDIQRSVSITNYTVNDMHYSQGFVRILSVRDGELFLDVIDLKLAIAESKSSANNQKKFTSTNYDSPFKCLDFQWPYIYYIYQSKFAVVISANHANTIFSFFLPKNKEKEKRKLQVIYVTQNHEMYLATLSNDEYSIYRLAENLGNLSNPSLIEDNSKQKKLQLQNLLTYKMNQIVSNDPIYNLWVKSSSNSKAPLAAINAGNNLQSQSKEHKTENIRATQDAVLMMLHKNNLYSCQEGQQMLIHEGFMRNAKYVDQDNIYYETVSGGSGASLKGPSSSVNRIQIIYSTLKKHTIYQVTNSNFAVQNFSFDYSLQRVYVLIRDKTQANPRFYIVIVDPINIEVLKKVEITDIPDLLGSFQGSKHFIVNGNFYCRNLVYRLDPFNHPEVLFQKYDELIPCQKQIEKVIFISPIPSGHHQKVLYIKKDLNGGALRTATIMPYLDERKIVISTRDHNFGSTFWMLADVPIQKEDTLMGSQQNDLLSMHGKDNNQREEKIMTENVNNFNTEIGEESGLPSKFQSTFATQNQKKSEFLTKDSKERSSNDQIHLLQQPKSPRQRMGFINQFFGVDKKSKVHDLQSNTQIQKDQSQTVQKIISLNIPNQRISVFSIQGQLERTLSFFPKEEHDQKDPIAISQDGQIVVFKGRQDPLELTVSKIDVLEDGFQSRNSCNWIAHIDSLVLGSPQTLSFLLPNLQVPETSSLPAISVTTKIMQSFSKKFQGLNPTSERLATDNDLDQAKMINSDRGKSEEISLTQESILQQVNTQLRKQYKIRVKINNDADICVSLIENRQPLYQKNRAKHGISNFQEEPEKYLGAKQQDELDKKFGIRKDLKKRVFMVIMPPKEGESQPKMYVIENENHFAYMKFPKQFLISRENIFFWNLQKVSAWNFKKMELSPSIPELKKIGFSIPNEDWERSIIKNVSTSGIESTDKVLLIAVNVSKNLDSVIIWDLEADIEMDSYEVEPQSQNMFDSKGGIYILEKDHVIINNTGGCCFSYQIDENPYFNEWKDEKITSDFQKLSRGCRIDPKFGNYILLPNVLHLSQSYLSIIITQQNAEKEHKSEQVFDPIAFPYYFNRQSELHQLVNDPIALEQLLSFYEEKDVRYLDHMLLGDIKGYSSIHIATNNGVSKTISILLKKLKRVNMNNTSLMKDIFDDFLDYVFFMDYLNECYFQTIQMKGIPSLNLPVQDDDSAVVVDHTNSFLTIKVFERVVKDGAASLPVEVKAFDLYWILNSEDGSTFLLKLCQQNNDDFFTTEFISTLILFLWEPYKMRIIQFQMIPFFVYFGMFISLVSYNENYISSNEDHASSDSSGVILHKGDFEVVKWLSIALLFIIGYFFLLLCLKCMSLGRIFWKFMWVWLNMISNSLNLAIIIMTMNQNQDENETNGNNISIFNMRRLKAVGVLLMWVRLLYFFRIMDSTAPLIRMIQEILYDMRAFVFMFVLIIFGFANGFYVLAKNQSDAIKTENGGTEIPYMNYGQSLLYVYLTSVGEFSTESFAIGEDTGLLWAFFMMTTFFLSIVMLNMLIAMMGRSYQKISEKARASMLKERMLLIMENYFLIPKKTFSKAKYLISFAPVQQKSEEEESQKMQTMMMEKMIQQIEKLARENSEIKMQLASGQQQIEMLASEMKTQQESGIKEIKAELLAANHKKQSKK